MIRKAKTRDVQFIHKLLSYYATQDLLLPRSLIEIYDHLRDFYVEVSNDSKADLLGFCALSISWEDLGEIRSLSVIEKSQKRGIGSRLVAACLSEASKLGLSKVFVLTLKKNFFFKLGFKEIEKSSLPNKIWADCVKCPKFPDCDESAMIISL